MKNNVDSNIINPVIISDIESVESIFIGISKRHKTFFPCHHI